MTPRDWVDLIQLVGLPVAVLLSILWLFLRGKIHSDSEFKEMQAQRNRYRSQLDRLLNVQEETIPVIKEATQKRAEIKSLEDMAKLVDSARDKGLI